MELSRHRSYLAIMGMSMVNIFGAAITRPIMPLYIRSFGATLTDLGLVSTLDALGFAFFEPALGIISDRIGRKRILLCACAAFAFITFAYTFASEIWHLYPLAFLMAAASAGRAVVTRALIAEFMPSSSRGRAYGAYNATLSIGRIVGPILGGLVAETTDMKMTFYLSAIVFAANTALALRLQEPPAKASVHPWKVDLKNGLKNFTGIGILLFMISRGLQFLSRFLVESLLFVYAKESPVIGATESQIGLMTGIGGIATGVSNLLLGSVSDRAGRKTMLIAGLSGVSFSIFGFGLAGSFQELILFHIAYDVSSVAYNMNMMLVLIEAIPRDLYGSAMGLYGLSEDMGAIFGNISLGVVSDLFGFQASASFTSLEMLVTCLVVSLSFRYMSQDSSKKNQE